MCSAISRLHKFLDCAEHIHIFKRLNGVCTLFRDRTFVYPRTARSQRQSDSPVVSETAGSQRGMRGKGKTASARSCKLVE